ncbi:hypothetical protein VTK73DRAFT_5032 [Phialemonium thermophilum]|uniref:Uncharacterized protein n=1 Tax=Phialemonium thermophilum TaxID=223376 RepID=A0ABR3WQP1_9PEZI
MKDGENLSYQQYVRHLEIRAYLLLHVGQSIPMATRPPWSLLRKSGIRKQSFYSQRDDLHSPKAGDHG